MDTGVGEISPFLRSSALRHRTDILFFLMRRPAKPPPQRSGRREIQHPKNAQVRFAVAVIFRRGFRKNKMSRQVDKSY